MLAKIKKCIKFLLPEEVLMAQLVLRRSVIWKKTGLIFIHVPKNGGTSINNALYGRFMGHFRVRDIERLRPDLLHTLPSMAVTRNPWARAYSAYTFARRGAAMTDGAQINDAQRYTRPEFESFERFVLEWLPARDLTREDYVFRPQTHFILNSQRDVAVAHLGRIENPASYRTFLEDTLGRKVEIRHLNRTARPAHYREAYTIEMRRVLARCYACDLEKFDYDF